MKHVVENGHPNFRLGLLKKSAGIKEATSKISCASIMMFVQHKKVQSMCIHTPFIQKVQQLCFFI